MPNYLKHLIKIGLVPFIIFLLNYSLNTLFFDWYTNNHLDIYMHIVGGMSAAYSVNYAIQLLEKNKKMMVTPLLLRWLIIICAVMAIAVLWEDYEFLWDHFYGTHHQPSLFDTMKDLFDGMLGAVITCLAFVRNKK